MISEANGLIMQDSIIVYQKKKKEACCCYDNIYTHNILAAVKINCCVIEKFYRLPPLGFRYPTKVFWKAGLFWIRSR